MEGSPAGTLLSMSTQYSLQTTYEDFMVKRDGLGERKTNDASTQLPEVSKESNGWDMGKNSGKKRKRSRKCIDFSVLFSQMSTRGKHRRNQTIN